MNDHVEPEEQTFKNNHLIRKQYFFQIKQQGATGLDLNRVLLDLIVYKQEFSIGYR